MGLDQDRIEIFINNMAVEFLDKDFKTISRTNVAVMGLSCCKKTVY